VLRWDIYRVAAKAKWIGTVEAVEADAAIKDAAKEFNIVDRRTRSLSHSGSDRSLRPIGCAGTTKSPAPFSTRRPNCRSGLPSGLGARSAC
jgi:hypothetical protein